VQDQAVVYGEIDSLPVGWGDTQEAGHYRLRSRDDQSRFGYNLGPSTWKQFLFPPEEAIFRVQDGEFVSAREAPQKMAFIGVRGCELAAIAVQDRVFLGEVEDPGYAARRRNLLLVAVNCAQAAATCFCTSTGDGPRAGAGADLVLTELNPEDPHYLVEAPARRERSCWQFSAGTTPAASDALEVDALLAGTRDQIQRKLPMDGLADDLLGALEHPHWDEVAQRCLACGNCTQVCPTCFCNSTHEQVDPLSLDVTHLRRWDSCFTRAIPIPPAAWPTRASVPLPSVADAQAGELGAAVRHLRLHGLRPLYQLVPGGLSTSPSKRRACGRPRETHCRRDAGTPVFPRSTGSLRAAHGWLWRERDLPGR
jgi:sulfhydrogenase subunit beta (sulfur reductase)